jgi:CheY-like chemotaxis protein
MSWSVFFLWLPQGIQAEYSIVADHGQDALAALENAHAKYLQTCKGLYDVVLMDLEMPGGPWRSLSRSFGATLRS